MVPYMWRVEIESHFIPATALWSIVHLKVIDLLGSPRELHNWFKGSRQTDNWTWICFHYFCLQPSKQNTTNQDHVLWIGVYLIHHTFAATHGKHTERLDHAHPIPYSQQVMSAPEDAFFKYWHSLLGGPWSSSTSNEMQQERQGEVCKAKIYHDVYTRDQEK